MAKNDGETVTKYYEQCWDLLRYQTQKFVATWKQGFDVRNLILILVLETMVKDPLKVLEKKARRARKGAYKVIKGGHREI